MGEPQDTNNAGNITGTSIFDPVLCEIMYSWFCPRDGKIIDPFAGGSVRGIVAAVLGRNYTGVDLRPEQCAANENQYTGISGRLQLTATPEWLCGDSLDVIPALRNDFDFIFSCPPYFNLEIYSDDPRDLSTMDYPKFIIAYHKIIGASCDKLSGNRFACFVVGDVRDKKGIYRNFVSETISAFNYAGLDLYNEAILITSVGSLSLRVGKQMAASRKMGKSHQNVLVFIKGDPRKAADNIGEIFITDKIINTAEQGELFNEL